MSAEDNVKVWLTPSKDAWNPNQNYLLWVVIDQAKKSSGVPSAVVGRIMAPELHVAPELF